MGEVVEFPVDGARVALMGMFSDKLPPGYTAAEVATYSDWIMVELWTRGYVIVPYLLVEARKLDS